MNKKLVIIGGEGNGGVIAACVEDNRNRYNDYEWEISGFVNDYEDEVCGYPVLGKLSDIQKLLLNPEYYFIWAIHLVCRNYKTKELFSKANIPLERYATIIHKSAFVAPSAVLEPGVFVMSNCYIGANTRIGMCSLIMANCSIAHNVTMGALCHCSIGSIMTGYSSLGFCADMAIGASCLAHIHVGDYAMVGASSLATHDIPDSEIHVGSPARFLKKMPID